MNNNPLQCQLTCTDIPNEISLHCQLKNNYKFRQKNSRLNIYYQTFLSYIKAIGLFLKNLFKYLLVWKHRVTPELFKVSVGDIVKIKSKKEIQKTLDFFEAYRKCGFSNEMNQYCGKEFKVIKVVNYFYDESKHKLCKCKNIVLLEGIYCSGYRKFRLNSCDTNCFYFWSTAWLEKVSKQS